jgi:hypothetical protein
MGLWPSKGAIPDAAQLTECNRLQLCPVGQTYIGA